MGLLQILKRWEYVLWIRNLLNLNYNVTIILQKRKQSKSKKVNRSDFNDPYLDSSDVESFSSLSSSSDEDRTHHITDLPCEISPNLLHNRNDCVIPDQTESKFGVLLFFTFVHLQRYFILYLQNYIFVQIYKPIENQFNSDSKQTKTKKMLKKLSNNNMFSLEQLGKFD